MTHSFAANSVDVLHEGDDWIVRVTINGHSEDNQFTLEKSARTFAEGQRFRLLMLDNKVAAGTKKSAG